MPETGTLKTAIDHAVPPLRREQEMAFGTHFTATGVRFRLWAPHAEKMTLRLIGPEMTIDMERLPGGWFSCEVAGVSAGRRYWFVLEDGTEVPDPASRHQPEDVHGPSEIIDPLAFEWTDKGWRGRPWHEAVIYELHVGTFTPKGTFRAAIERLDHLVRLGITAIELMPLADFRGGWNWGYDGVLLFAPDASYGRPDDLKALVNAAHDRGLMVILDVVYNHFGPEGHYMGMYAPVHTDKHMTPWGPGVNFDDQGAGQVREFIISNARYWLNEFRFDGLRLDAVHEINDAGPRHVLMEAAEQIRASTPGRHIHLVIENALNQAGWLKRRIDGLPWLYDAQWNDDYHHAVQWALTGQSFWYYADFAERLDLLARALAQGLGWQGEFMPHEGIERGEPSAFLPPTAFVCYMQNHDQIGNRPHGERLTTLTSPEKLRAAAALTLLAPHIPMLFMGEEWGCERPFLFFCDLGDDLAQSIRTSRAEELDRFPGGAEGAPPPDPVSRAAFEASKLDWEAIEASEGASLLAFYRDLLAIRSQWIIPRLAGMEGHSGSFQMLAGRAFRVEWRLGDGSRLSVTANLDDKDLQAPLTGNAGKTLWLEGAARNSEIGPWSVLWQLMPEP